ncbi:RHS repeat-associated core domain-containing protein [Paenibacillus abyssi]|nr:RHS repeat-associated core domain-containing protein [Paenibacillus abyssi]
MLGTHKFDTNDRQGPGGLFGYTGLGYDYTNGLNYARARYYQPELGRFISEDTYKGDMWNPQSQNLYGYVHNNPLIYTDPTGHKVWLIHGTNLMKVDNPEDTWTPEFREYIGDLYDEDVARHYWSGGNNKPARKEAAEALAEEII